MESADNRAATEQGVAADYSAVSAAVELCNMR